MGSEMCIRDRKKPVFETVAFVSGVREHPVSRTDAVRASTENCFFAFIISCSFYDDDVSVLSIYDYHHNTI